MADIAAVFHWAPRDMDPMTIWELARWWGKARARAPQAEEEENG
jgi:hypothetical protein